MAQMDFFQRDPFEAFDANISPSHFAYDDTLSSSPISLYPPMSFDQWPTPSISRRGSACSNITAASSIDDVMQGLLESSSSPQARLTPEQSLLLERQFSESPKPSTKVRRALAEVTGLSAQRVANWFQNRRAKAKQQKRQEELHTHRILESAGRRRATEPSSPNPSFPASSQSFSLPPRPFDENMLATPQQPRRTKSTSAIPSTPSDMPGLLPKHSPYASPAEASYASLTRTLAVAAAAEAHAEATGGDYQPSLAYTGLIGGNIPGPTGLDGPQSPWPVSAFSDYGSSVPSSYAPTPLNQLEDPFEFDQSYNSQPPSRGGAPYFVEPPTVDYVAFATALQMNTPSFTHPSAPSPCRPLKERRNSPWQYQLQLPSPVQEDQEKSMQDDTSVPVKRDVSMAIEQDLSSNSTLSGRRRTPKPLSSNCMLRSQSFVGPYGGEINKGRLSPLPSMRRTRSIGSSRQRRLSKSPGPRSPLYLKKPVDASVFGDWPDTAATIRPRTAGSLSTTRLPVSEVFSQNAVPLTPISPANSEASSNRASNSERRPDDSPIARRDCQISPPPTPFGSSATDDTQSKEDRLVDMELDDILSIPRGLCNVSPGTMHCLDPFGMEDLCRQGDGTAPFPFECYISSSSPTSPPHMATAATGTSF